MPVKKSAKQTTKVGKSITAIPAVTVVDSATITETGVIDLGNEKWVSPVIVQALAGKPVVFNQSVGLSEDVPSDNLEASGS